MNTDAYIFKYLKDSVDLSKQQETFLLKKEVQFMLTHVLRDHLAFLRGPKTRKAQESFFAVSCDIILFMRNVVETKAPQSHI